MIVDARRGNVLVPEPLLHLSNVGVVGQRIRRCGRTHGMNAEAVDLDIEACLLPIFHDDVVIAGPG